MTKEQKAEVIEVLRDKFSQYSNFYIADTEALSVEQIGTLRRACFDKQVEMKVAKNTLIKKALESLDGANYSGVYDSLHKVTALLLSENSNEPALIISSFRKKSNKDKVELKAAFVNGDVYTGEENLAALFKLKTKEQLIGEVIELLQSPIRRLLGGLINPVNNDVFKKPIQNSGDTVVSTETENVVTQIKAVRIAGDSKQAFVGNKNDVAWVLDETVYAKVLEISETEVILECMIDLEQQSYENRKFSKSLFSLLPDLTHDKLILIEVFVRPGEIRFSFSDGADLFEKSLFDENYDFSEIESKLGS